MKRVLLLIFVFYFINIYGQDTLKEWAPIGAQWLYWTPNFSNFHECVRIAHDRDTIINKHTYKVFDVYDLLVVSIPNTGGRIENLSYSYYIGIVGDTVFSYCKDQKKERYYIDKDIIGEKIYLFKDCDPTDSVWYKLDTVYYGSIGGTANELKFKFRVYSSNMEYYPTYLNNGTSFENKKDTLVEFLPFKHSLVVTPHYGDNWNYNKYIKYSPLNCDCSVTYKTSKYSPDKFECYFDPNFGNYSFWGGQCWLKDAYLSIKNKESQHKFTIYPNPTNKHLKIKIDEIGDLVYIIYDSEAKFIQSGNLKNEEEVNIEKLNRGNYFISVQNKSEVIGVHKFIKQ